jgi:hypothetical protein
VLELFNLLRWILLDLFRSRSSLEAEVIALRHQLNVLRRGAPKRPALKTFDRLIFVLLYRLAPTVLDAVTIVRLRGLCADIVQAFACSGSGSLEDEWAGPRCLSNFGS